MATRRLVLLQRILRGRLRRTPTTTEAQLSKKRECGECATTRFGLIRHYLGSKHFCSLVCKELHVLRRQREIRDKKTLLSFFARASPTS